MPYENLFLFSFSSLVVDTCEYAGDTDTAIAIASYPNPVLSSLPIGMWYIYNQRVVVHSLVVSGCQARPNCVAMANACSCKETSHIYIYLAGLIITRGKGIYCGYIAGNKSCVY